MAFYDSYSLRGLVLPALLFVAGCHTGRPPGAANQPSSPPLDSLYPAPDTTILYQSGWTKTHYPKRIAEFKQNPLNQHDIVFIGNSITEQGGAWDKRLGSGIVKNRGISGDVTAGVLKRLGEIGHYRPKAVFLLIGINDLSNDQSTPEYVANNIHAIAAALHQATPRTKIYVQTILPTTNEKLAAKIKQTNDLLKSQTGPNFTLLDTHALFADDHDLMKKELTRDGLHLTEVGYQLWAGYLKRYIH